MGFPPCVFFLPRFERTCVTGAPKMVETFIPTPIWRQVGHDIHLWFMERRLWTSDQSHGVIWGLFFGVKKWSRDFLGWKYMKVSFFFKISLSGCQRVDFERFLSQVGEGKFATVGKGDFGEIYTIPTRERSHIPPLVKRKIIDSKGYDDRSL